MSAVRSGQTWEHRPPMGSRRSVVVLTLRPPPRLHSEWACLVLDGAGAGSVRDFCVNNSDWWVRLA